MISPGYRATGFNQEKPDPSSSIGGRMEFPAATDFKLTERSIFRHKATADPGKRN